MRNEALDEVDVAVDGQAVSPPIVVDVDAVISAGVGMGWSFRRTSAHLATLGVSLSHESVRSRVAKLEADGKPLNRQYPRSPSKSDEAYVAAAAMAALRPSPAQSLGGSPMVKPIPFMRNNPDMLLGWRKAGLGAKQIASILTAMGMPVAAQTVSNVSSRELEALANPERVDLIAARVNLLLASGVAIQSALPFAGMPPLSAAPLPSLEMQRHPLPLNTPPLQPVVQAAPPSVHRPAMERAGAARTFEHASQRTAARPAASSVATPPPSASNDLEDSADLSALPGEEEDFDLTRTLWPDPVSYRELRTALWEAAQAGSQRVYRVGPGSRELMDIQARLARKAIDGTLCNWKDFIHELGK